MTTKLFAFAVIFCLFISGCDSAHPFGKWKKESGDIEEFRIGVVGYKSYYDTNFFQAFEIDPLTSSFIFGTIIDHQFNNDLAENITFSENGMECVVKLRKEVFFHDGSKLTAEDVIYSLNEYKKNVSDNNIPGVPAKGIQDLTAENIGKGELFFKLNAPGFLKHSLSEFPITIERYDENYRGKPPSEYIPNGTGSMRFGNYDRSKGMLTMERFDGYYAGIPKIVKMVIKSYSDGDSLEMALLKNEVDLSTNHVAYDKYLKHNKKYIWFEEPSHYSAHIIFDILSPNLKDWRVRKALSLLIDRKAIVNDPYGLAGRATPTSVAFSYSHPITKPVSDKPDTTRAMEFFRQAGYKRNNGKLMRDGKRLNLTITFRPGMILYGEYIVRSLGKMWERAGVGIVLKENENNYHDAPPGEVEITEAPDRQILSSNELRVISKKNGWLVKTNFSDRELERLFLESSKESRDSVLLEKKSLIQQRIKDTCPIIPLFYRNSCFVLGGKLAENDNLVKAISKDPILLRHLSRYVK